MIGGWRFPAPTGRRPAETRPIVVELFTSQGCSSCPPADALLDQLSHRDDVVALGYHVDYWDNLGWKDPFSSPEATARQRGYAARFDKGRQFTPQIVVDGREDMVGSDRDALMAALKTQPQAVAPVRFAADCSAVTIGAGSGKGWVLLLRFAQHRTTKIGAGENAHRTAEDTNAVLSVETRGEWNGTVRGISRSRCFRRAKATRCWCKPATARSSAPARPWVPGRSCLRRRARSSVRRAILPGR